MYLLQPFPLTAIILSLIFAFLDWRTREVPIWLLSAAGVIGIGMCIFEKREAVSILYALIPGILMLGAAFLSKQAVGTGDGAYVCLMSLFLTWQQVCILLGTAFLSAGLVSLIIIIRLMAQGRKAYGKKLPFLCFMPPGVLLAFLLTCE